MLRSHYSALHMELPIAPLEAGGTQLFGIPAGRTWRGWLWSAIISARCRAAWLQTEAPWPSLACVRRKAARKDMVSTCQRAGAMSAGTMGARARAALLAPPRAAPSSPRPS